MPYVGDATGACLRASLQGYIIGLVEVDDEDIESEMPHGPEDQLLKALIESFPELKAYFNNLKDYKVPPILNGNNFKKTHELDVKAGITEFIAEDRPGRKYILSIPDAGTDRNTLRRYLKEYMLQHQAHTVLNGTCTTPKPIGFIRTKLDPNGLRKYIMVSNFVPLYAGATCTLDLFRALLTHRFNPLISRKEWRNVCLSLITAFETLQKNDIYHNNINVYNILLHFYENEVQPVIINFNHASRGVNTDPVTNEDGTKTFYSKTLHKEHHIAPELFEQANPLPTTDVHGLACLIAAVGSQLTLPAVIQYAKDCQAKRPQKRPSFSQLFRGFQLAFELEVLPGPKIDFTGPLTVAKMSKGNVHSQSILLLNDNYIKE